MSLHGTFATAINCMDGRVQLPVIEWLKREYQVDYVDTITEPGPNKILAEAKDTTTLDSIKRRLDISINKHHSKLIAIVGHHDCAGNPVSGEMQLRHLADAAKTACAWGYKVPIIRLWVDENWKVIRIE